MRDMDKWLGDGGMPILGEVGLDLDQYGQGWVSGTWTPTNKALKPAGGRHGGVQTMVHDALQNFAASAALEKGEFGTTLELKVSMQRGGTDQQVTVRGEVVRITRSVAMLESWVRNLEGEVISHGTGTMLLRRRQA